MQCYHPVRMAYSNRYLTRNGKRAVTGRASPDASTPLLVPCGQCLGCRLERSRHWAIRCMMEAQLHDRNVFVTLTYRDQDLIFRDTDRATLYPRHFTLFMKRLRKEFGNGIKFYGCGEYGDKYGRPHYHAIIFGLDFEDKTVCDSQNGVDYYRSDTLNRIWSHGDCIIGDVSLESCAYVARYVMKKLNGEKASYYEEQGIHPEFVRMSRGNAKSGPNGIGRQWLEQYWSDVYPRGNVILRGFPQSPPKYFDRWYEEKEPKKMKEIKEKRRSFADKNEDGYLKSRLEAKEQVKLSATKSLKRKVE